MSFDDTTWTGGGYCGYTAITGKYCVGGARSNVGQHFVLVGAVIERYTHSQSRVADVTSTRVLGNRSTISAMCIMQGLLCVTSVVVGHRTKHCC